MGMTEKIKIIMIKKNTSVKDLAEKLNTTSSNLTNKFKRNNFSEKELIDIAEALDCEYNATFTIKNTGEKV